MLQGCTASNRDGVFARVQVLWISSTNANTNTNTNTNTAASNHVYVYEQSLEVQHCGYQPT
jgi:hypothetical protein